MNYEKKDDSPFDQFLNLSGSSSDLNSPVVGQAPQGGFLPQQGAYQQLSRPVPGLKTDYNLKKASSQTDLQPEEHQQQVPHIQPPPQYQTHVSQEDVSLFLDELNSLNSPSNHFNFHGQFDSGRGSPQYMNAPVIISTPPQDEAALPSHSSSSHNLGVPTMNNAQNPMDLTMNHLNPTMDIHNQGFSDFLQPDFQGSAFQQHRSPQGALSDMASSVSNSPFLQAYSPAPYEDDLISNNGQDFLDYNVGMAMDPNMGNTNNEVDLLSAQMDMRLTEENLHQATQSPVTISISTAPDDSQVHKTPSLFSSNKSSRNNTPNHSRAGSNSSQLKSGHFAQTLKAESGSSTEYNAAAVDESDLLNPDDLHSQMRAGRQRRQSRSRSRSASRERDRSLSANREKMLELASPNAPNKRTQKHPSIYACHLCEKRFTRPYNLKSHLRTHTDERPFVCTVCGKAFARQHDRKRHEDLHSGEKRYECRGTLRDGVSRWGCGKKFARTDALGRHFKTEAGKECIRPLLEEHEREMRQEAAANGTQFTPFDVNALPEQLFTQFPGLMDPSQGNGLSDLSDIE